MDLLKNLKPKAKLNRNGFDLSNRQLFSAKAGQLLPVQCVECVPGDKVQIDVMALARTMPLNTAAFMRAKQFFHFFYVPYQALWHQWDSFISQRENKESSYVNSSEFCPNFSRKELLNEIFNLDNVAGSTGIKKDIHGFSRAHNALRLMDLLGYGSANNYFSDTFDDPLFANRVFEGETGDKVTESRPNAWRILAYQKIYNDYYQNKYFEAPVPETFNVDDVPCDTYANSEIFNARKSKSATPALDLFELRYRPYKKDLYMGVLPSPQFGSPSSVGFVDKYLFVGHNSTGIHTSNYLGIKPMPPNSQANTDNAQALWSDGRPQWMVGLANFQNGTNTPPNMYSAKFSIPDVFDVLTLRKAEALQRWKENTVRAGRDHRDQQLAHFGVTASNSFNNHAQFLGGYDSVINVDEVISTASTDDAVLGQMAGKGISAVRGEKINFEASDFGVLMCIYSVVPESDYDSDGIDRCNQMVDAFDYFTPEFENLGFEAVSSKEINDATVLAAGNSGQSVVGYAPRYYGYKTRVDKVHGIFQTNRSLNAWTTPRRDLVAGIKKDTAFKLKLPHLYIDPRVLDTVFAQACTDHEDSDQFLVSSFFDIKAVRPMSILGLPNS